MIIGILAAGIGIGVLFVGVVGLAAFVKAFETIFDIH